VSIVAVAFVGGTLTGITGPCLRALLLSVNAPETRGSAQAMLVLTDDLGKGVGPLGMVRVCLRECKGAGEVAQGGCCERERPRF